MTGLSADTTDTKRIEYRILALFVWRKHTVVLPALVNWRLYLEMGSKGGLGRIAPAHFLLLIDSHLH